jgi:hypothetical protein
MRKRSIARTMDRAFILSGYTKLSIEKVCEGVFSLMMKRMPILCSHCRKKVASHQLSHMAINLYEDYDTNTCMSYARRAHIPKLQYDGALLRN